MNLTFRLAEENDTDELEKFYYRVNDYLSATTNYPGWRKGAYPARETAEKGIREGCLHIAICNNQIVGTMILRQEPEPAYLPVKWLKELDYKDVIVIHTFAVDPDYQGQGIGHNLLDYAVQIGRRAGIKSLRLDVYESNLPAIRFYEKYGFRYIDTVDLGLAEFHLNWFKLYEKLL